MLMHCQHIDDAKRFNTQNEQLWATKYNEPWKDLHEILRRLIQQNLHPSAGISTESEHLVCHTTGQRRQSNHIKYNIYFRY